MKYYVKELDGKIVRHFVNHPRKDGEYNNYAKPTDYEVTEAQFNAADTLKLQNGAIVEDAVEVGKVNALKAKRTIRKKILKLREVEILRLVKQKAILNAAEIAVADEMIADLTK